MEFLKAIQEMIPWAHELPVAPKAALSLLVVGLAGFTLLLLWTPSPQQARREFAGWRATLYKNDVRVRDLYEQLPGLPRESDSSPIRQLQELVEVSQAEGIVKILETPSDWSSVTPGTLVLFAGKFEFDSGGLSREQLFALPAGEARPLALRGVIGGRSAIIPFSSSHVISPTVISILFLNEAINARGVAIVSAVGSPTSDALLEPVEFGS